MLQRVAKQCTMRSRRAQQRRPSPQQRVSKQRTMQSAWKYALHFSFEISTLRRFPLSRLRAEGSRAPQLYSELHTLLSLCWNATIEKPYKNYSQKQKEQTHNDLCHNQSKNPAPGWGKYQFHSSRLKNHRATIPNRNT